MFNIPSCTSQNSIDIIASNMDLPSSSSSSSSSSTFVAGGRALDRHNPIITDEKRSGSSSKPGTPLGTPCTHNTLQQKPKTPIPPTLNNSPMTLKKKGNKSPLLRMNKFNNNTSKKNVSTKSSFIENNHDHNHNDDVGRESFSTKPSDLIMKAAACKSSKPGVDYYSPPESSRYLLNDTSFLDVFADFEPVLKLAPYSNNSKHGEVSKVDQASKTLSKPPSSSSSGSSDQVVVLRVSLHCRGCERKMKKHLSRMPGVTSFNIDFAAKKVTVIGDVTPLGVLASISKVKTTKLWAPAMPSSSQINTRNIEVKM